MTMKPDLFSFQERRDKGIMHNQACFAAVFVSPGPAEVQKQTGNKHVLVQFSSECVTGSEAQGEAVTDRQLVWDGN